MKLQKNTSRRDIEFQVDDYVYLKLQMYRQQSLAKRLCAKLAARYMDRFEYFNALEPLPTSFSCPPVHKSTPCFTFHN